ncbi:MAG: citrate transporter [Oscillospiraceae bacterium]|nr:citrate transporter [Oscillospiraceae bacterium]
MKKVVHFIKKEAVLCASGVLAIVSCFIVPPSAKYLEYIDLRVLALLFCLMAVVAGIRAAGAFDVICEALLKRLRSIKAVGLALVLLSFFMSMLLTNDVALVTLVPFTLLLFESINGEKKARAEIILLVLETAAANLGSMLTPMGNPQNLYLYSKFNLMFSEFLTIIFPYSLLSLVLLIASVFLFLPKLRIEKTEKNGSAALHGRMKAVLFLILFAVCMLSILRILDYRILLGIIVIAVLILDRRLFLKVDYSLLLTFVFFFIFVGNLGSIPALSESLRGVLQGREVWLGIALSQVISNVPAAILLSGLSENAPSLIIGTNLGGLGTLIASMASLITYKFYAASNGSSPKKYMLIFTAFNLAYLALLCGLYAIIH